MNAVATPIRPSVKRQPAAASRKVSEYEIEFLRGRDLAIKALEEAERIQDANSEESFHYRWARKGAAIDNYFLGYMAEVLPNWEPLLQDPAMAGFGAVMSSFLAYNGGTLYPNALALPMAEFQAGEVGADGTSPVPDGVEGYGPTANGGAEQSALPNTCLSESSGHLMSDAIQHAEPKIAQAVHLLRHCAEYGEGSAEWGLLRLAETIKPQLDAGLRRYILGTPVTNVLTDLSCSILELVALICAVNSELDNLTLHAVESILGIAKATIDDASEKVMEAQREVAK